MKTLIRRIRTFALGRRAVAAWALVGAGLTAAAPASADSCREWSQEHREWKAEAVRRYLDGSPAEAMDTAVFEMLQREAYLTSCNVPVARAREAMVGWRLVGLAPDEYGRAVVESLLAESGMAMDVRSWFGPLVSQAPPPLDDGIGPYDDAPSIEYLSDDEAAAPVAPGRAR